MTRRRPIISALVLLSGVVLAAWGEPATAQPTGNGLGRYGTSLEVRVGWGGAIQAGRWHPVYLTLSHPVSRSVTLEFRAPHGSYFGMRSRMAMTIGPEPQTFIVYMPLRHFMPEDLAFVVRDSATRRQLANYPAGPFVSFAPTEHTSPGHSFLGISGRRATLRPVTDALPGAKLSAAHVEQEELPTSAIGYDCLDVLVLNAPDFTRLASDQQQAIVEWVRTGGNLLLWPGDTPVPSSGPLLDVLPCQIGNTAVVELSPDELKSAGLSPRFAKLPARRLTPGANAEKVELLGISRISAYQGRAGLGRIVVCPIDLASLQMADPGKVWAQWRVVLKGMIRRLPADGVTAPQQTYEITGETQQREATAMRQVGDMLGAVEGAGQFGFGYVAGILVAMMVIVGPVDWLLLKRLGRQPWTWATTTGWIGLVTLSAVYAGHLFKSGELHFRTFQLVDQADGLAVARTDLTALYSPRTTEYDLETSPDAWWQPASPGDELYGYRRAGQEIVFSQSYRGSTPDPMVVNVWNLRFLAGESTTAAAPLIDAKLRVEQRDVGGKPRKHLVGSITNVGNEPLVNVAVRTQAGWVRLFTGGGDTQPAAPARIEPGQSVEVDAIIDTTAPVVSAAPNDWQRARYPYYPGNVTQIDRARLWDQGGDLSMRRTDRIEQWVTERADLACVYAECESPTPVVDLNAAQPIEAHWKVVRALVTLDGQR